MKKKGSRRKRQSEGGATLDNVLKKATLGGTKEQQPKASQQSLLWQRESECKVPRERALLVCSGQPRPRVQETRRNREGNWVREVEKRKIMWGLAG